MNNLTYMHPKLTATYQKIWQAAFFYQDKRDDTGHVETVVNFALQLLEINNIKEAGADEQIVLPAAILHDIGWSQLSRNQRMSSVDGSFRNHPDKERYIRRKHEQEGADFAQKILRGLDYEPAKKIPEIIEIISQHDTREDWLNINDGVMRDADKLWRFSFLGLQADIVRDISSERGYNYWMARREKEINQQGFFFTKSAKSIAKDQLKKRESDSLP